MKRAKTHERFLFLHTSSYPARSLKFVARSAAIILHSFRYSESSKIVQLFTQEWGWISCLAKGALRPRSPFSGLLEPGQSCEIEVVFRHRSGLHILTQCQLNAAPEPRLSVEASAVQYLLLEAILLNVPREEQQVSVFRLLTRALTRIRDRELPFPAACLLLDLFLIRLASDLGFCIPSGQEAVRGKAGSPPLHPADWKCLQQLRTGKMEQLRGKGFGPDALFRICHYLLEYLSSSNDRHSLPRSWHHLRRIWEKDIDG
jgi:hypothetical protein